MARLPALNWPKVLPDVPEASWIRVSIRHPQKIDLNRLQQALITVLHATPETWKDVATRNHLPAADPAEAGPNWACSGVYFWAATEHPTDSSAELHLGICSKKGSARPPDVGDLARIGPRELQEVLREYRSWSRRKPEIIVEMVEGGRESGMTLADMQDWIAMLKDKSVLAVPVTLFSAVVVAAFARYGSTAQTPNSGINPLFPFLTTMGIGVIIAAVLWFAIARAAVRQKPRWIRRGWEVE